MKHLIIGCGTVGYATGTFLEANNFDVTYYDINKILITRLKLEGKKTISYFKNKSFDVLWFCVKETQLENAFSIIPKKLLWKSIVIIRSSTLPGTMDKISSNYNIKSLYHIPEFLKEKTSIEDTFNADRIVIGIGEDDADYVLQFFEAFNIPKIETTFIESELIKLIANAWLSTQISFWNEIKELCDTYNLNPQLIANTITLDRRISKYGTNLLGKPFEGKCLPKDLENLLQCYKNRGLNSTILHAVRNKNDYKRSINEHNTKIRKCNKKSI